jgi:pimeloyl-ACP methyl ester carboxylesterase
MPRMSFATGAVVRRLYGDPRRISPGTVEGYSKPCTAGGSFDHVLKILKTWTVDLKELERALARVADVPTLLIWGSKDRAVFPESAQVLARHFRHCELVEFSGVGHLPYEEIPEQFNAAVVDFLTYIVCTNAFGAEGTRTILPLHGRAHLRNFAQLLDRLWLLGGSG